MFVLISFDGGVTGIAYPDSVLRKQIQGDVYIAQIKGKKYEVQVLAYHENLEILENISKNMMEAIPKLILSDVYTEMKKNKTSVDAGVIEDTKFPKLSLSHELTNPKLASSVSVSAPDLTDDHQKILLFDAYVPCVDTLPPDTNYSTPSVSDDQSKNPTITSIESLRINYIDLLKNSAQSSVKTALEETKIITQSLENASFEVSKSLNDDHRQSPVSGTDENSIRHSGLLGMDNALEVVEKVLDEFDESNSLKNVGSLNDHLIHFEESNSLKTRQIDLDNSESQNTSKKILLDDSDGSNFLKQFQVQLVHVEDLGEASSMEIRQTDLDYQSDNDKNPIVEDDGSNAFKNFDDPNYHVKDFEESNSLETGLTDLDDNKILSDYSSDEEDDYEPDEDDSSDTDSDSDSDNVGDDIHGNVGKDDSSKSIEKVRLSSSSCDVFNLSKDLHESETSAVKSNQDNSQVNISLINSSGEEYLPENDSAAYSINDSNNPEDVPLPMIDDAPENSSLDNQRFNISITTNVVGVQGPDVRNLRVDVSRGRSGANKKYFCFYCHKMVYKLARHLVGVHKKEEIVKKFSSLPVKSKERLDLIATLRNNGMYIHNTDEKKNTGEILVARRPKLSSAKSAGDFKTCSKCKVFVSKEGLRHHIAVCNKNMKKNTNERVHLVLGRKVNCSIHASASAIMRLHIFPVYRDCDVLYLMRYDRLIIAFGNKLCEKYAQLQHHFQMIRAKLKYLGKLLQIAKEVDPKITDLTSLFDPSFYETAKKSIQILAKYDEETNTYNHPYVVTHLFSLLKQCGSRLITLSIQDKNKDQQDNAEQFLKVLLEDYGASLNKGAVEHGARLRRKKKVDLPTKEDIALLHTLLKEKRTEAYKKLVKAFSFDAYIALAESVLCSLQVFNRRRAGEMERFLLEDFENRDVFTSDQKLHLLVKLNDSARKLAEQFSRTEIIGKLGRTVSVLMRCDIVKCIELLISYRSEANIPENNPYVFGLPSQDTTRDKYLRACGILRKFSMSCGASKPFSLRGTKLRKHVATACIELNLSENELLGVADFMGHDREIQKKVYCQPTFQRDVLQMSRLLQLVQGEKDDSAENCDEESADEAAEESAGEAAEESAGEAPDELNLPHSSANEMYQEDPFNVNLGLEQQNIKVSSARKSQDSTTSENRSPGIKRKSSGSTNSQNRSKEKKRKSSERPLGTTKKLRWTNEESSTILKLFGSYIKKDALPKSTEIYNKIKGLPISKTRTVPVIKTWLNNQQRKYRSQNLKPSRESGRVTAMHNKISLEQKVKSLRQDGLEVKNVTNKGRGVVTTKQFKKGDLVAEYVGELTDYQTGLQRDERYGKENNEHCYLFFFEYKNVKYCIDATVESKEIGRLINHSKKNSNLTPKIVEVDGTPRLIFIASKQIPSETELTYDYGERRQAAISQFPWLQS